MWVCPCMALYVLARLPRKHVGAMYSVSPGRIFFLRAAEAVETGRYAYVVKTQLLQERDELCLRQSAGDSTGPQVDVAARVFAELDIECDVSQLQSASRSQDTAYLLESFLFFRHEVEHPVGDDHIDAGIW